MTLGDLNIILNKLADRSDRETILDFAYALTGWMGLAPNGDKKPQLLAPQTQKLKDFLVPAAITNQPQLYRLTADNQNIRVRFAVLKKIKKDYISQLVDNDPGGTSYQAASKGIVNIPGRPVYIPSEPYFIHFVTTPAYDRLMLVFNKDDQKRIITFRNRLTHTQYNRIIEQWSGIATKSKPEIADLLWKSLDIKEVNKEFYKQIKERFDALVGIATDNKTKATESQVKQFAVRLIGRYIFCWFLKEKGIIPEILLSKATIDNTPRYYHTVLLNLFFKTLNTKVQDREPWQSFNQENQINHSADKIPYLNGGLFDENDEDKLFRDLDADDWLRSFVKVLEDYDFTVDESSSNYQHVAVDPEMLGRIFENLLASQNEETEKLANQRKAFGAFYTPREIVDYMVNESIKAYLQTQWEEHLKTNHTPDRDKIIVNQKNQINHSSDKMDKAFAALFAVQPNADGLKKDEKNLLISFLAKIKILDPACGSGAFPMGVLQKLVELHEVLGTVKSSYELKKDILSQNIYGVDIMPMAIEIARLRAWLSLVLEENYIDKDAKHNFGLKPLPNLDFKFVCANSLIDLGLDAFIKDNIGKLGFSQKLVNQLKELEELRKHFFLPDVEHEQKEELKNQYLQKRDEVVTAIDAGSEPKLIEIAAKIKVWDPFNDSMASPFFSPTWMFGIDKGFDVVIGNPPYIRQESANINKEDFQKRFKSFSGKADLYVFFYEQGHILLRENGVLCFITSSKFIKAGYGKPLLKFLSEAYQLINVIDFNDLPVFNGITTYPVVLSAFKKHLNNYTFGYYNLLELPVNSLQELLNNSKKKTLTRKEFIKSDFKFIDDANSELINKLRNNSVDLKDYVGPPIVGIKTGLNEAFLTSESVEHLVDYVFGRDIKKYQPVLSNQKIIFPYRKDYRLIPANELGSAKSYLLNKKNELSARAIINEGITKGNKVWYEYQQINKSVQIEKEHIVFPNVSLGNNFSMAKNIAIDMTAFIINSNSKYLLGVLNSKLIEFLMKIWGIERRGGYIEYKTQYVEKLPIKKLNDSQQLPFIERVEKIIKANEKNGNTTAFEKEIDVMVYKLYDLTYEEVKIVEPEFELSEEQYLGYAGEVV